MEQVLIICLFKHILVHLGRKLHLIGLLGLVHLGKQVLKEKSIVARLWLMLVLNLVEESLEVWVVLRCWSCHPALLDWCRLHILLHQELLKQLI